MTPEKEAHARRMLAHAEQIESETDRGCRSIFELFQCADINAAHKENNGESVHEG